MLAGREFKSRRVHDYQRCRRTPMSWGESKLIDLICLIVYLFNMVLCALNSNIVAMYY